LRIQKVHFGKRGMANFPTAEHSLIQLLKESGRPIYALDGQRRIVFCNPALEAWLGLESRRIVGRLVEYHSDESGDGGAARESGGPLTGLCPPPQALAGQSRTATVSCVTRDGRLLHRRAEFVPLHARAHLPNSEAPRDAPLVHGRMLAFVAESDLSPQDLAAHLSAEPTTDELHTAIRRFRRSQAGRYAVETLLGDGSGIRRVRAQVVAAATSGANTLVVGPPGCGRSHVAHAVHYHAAGDATAKLVPLDAELLTDDALRRALDSVVGPAGTAANRPTLLVEQFDRLSPTHQSEFLAAIRRGQLNARIIATAGADYADDARNGPNPLAVNAALSDAVSTITIRVPRLVDRLEDLPVLVQCFLEACNRDNPKQIGSMLPEALDLLALYGWPGELDELREVVAAAHRAANSPEIGPGDLPAVIHHAAKAAALPAKTRERIVLDELLAAIEREAILRALAQAGGNKSGAADLLGLTRPRLYRRLEQLGLADGPPRAPQMGEQSPQTPDFQEVDPQELEP
jgi:DNA-binding NtrC family response regulator